MNIFKWFQDKERMHAQDECVKYGLEIADTKLFEEYIHKRALTGFVYTLFLIVIIGYILWSWLM